MRSRSNVDFENVDGENICFAKYPALSKRGLKYKGRQAKHDNKRVWLMGNTWEC